MIINGKRAILEALQAEHPIAEIFISSTLQRHQSVTDLLVQADLNAVPVSTLSFKEFKQRYPENETQGIVAISHSVVFHSLSLLSNAVEYPKVVVLDHLEDPYNMGAIIRTCVGLGVSALIFGKDRQVKLTAGVIKASSGAVYHLPLIQVSNIAQSIIQLKKKGYWVYGTSLDAGVDINSVTINSPFVLVIGNEHKGISKRVSKMVDLNVYISMVGNINSLNVSVATGILLYKMIHND